MHVVIDYDLDITIYYGYYSPMKPASCRLPGDPECPAKLA
jgi:hypothetical protein